MTSFHDHPEKPGYWVFTSRIDNYSELKENDEVVWSSDESVRKGDLIFLYMAAPQSGIEFIMRATTDPYEDPGIRERWDNPAVKLKKIVEIPNPVKISEMKKKAVLSEWVGVKINMRRSHFKLSEKQFEAIKDLITEKNPQLKGDIKRLGGDRNIWKVSPGTSDLREKLWPVLKRNGYIGIGNFGCEEFQEKSYARYKTFESLRKKFKECLGRPTVGTVTRMAYNFVHVMKPGDIIVASNGASGVLGIGIVRGDYIPPYESPRSGLHEYGILNHLRKVEWVITDPIDTPEPLFDIKTVSSIDKPKWKSLKEAYIGRSEEYRPIFDYLEKRRRNLRGILGELIQLYRVESDTDERTERLLHEELPAVLRELTHYEYLISTASVDDGFPCDMVGIMNHSASSGLNDGLFVSYIFTQDAIYLTVTQGVRRDRGDKDYPRYLRCRSEELRKENGISEAPNVKLGSSSAARLYEDAIICATEYNADNLPAKDKLEMDLSLALELYDKMVENSFLSFMKELYSEELRIALAELEAGRNVIFSGPPGSGKTVLAKILSMEYLGDSSYVLYTVHSGTDYYDLVCRIVPQTGENGEVVYFKEKRFLLDALLSGGVLILDELNRTQIDTALGIFFTYLERSHRVQDAPKIRDILLNEIGESPPIEYLRKALSRFRVVGTLNVYDKTFLFKLGDALKRRFTFIDITTTPRIIESIAGSPERFISLCEYDKHVLMEILEIFSEINNIKPLGIGILKETMEYSRYYHSENAIDMAVAAKIIPFFENDMKYPEVMDVLEAHGLSASIEKLRAMNIQLQ